MLDEAFFLSQRPADVFGPAPPRFVRGAANGHASHVGMVISGRATAAMSNGEVVEMRAGQVFYIPPGHDSWVVGDQPYVSLHFFGASEYANRK